MQNGVSEENLGHESSTGKHSASEHSDILTQGVPSLSLSSSRLCSTRVSPPVIPQQMFIE